jgi:hypothetical protein
VLASTKRKGELDGVGGWVILLDLRTAKAGSRRWENMGEIKSTLELIMEKTKGLTMTDEEKRRFKEEEIVRDVKGLVQRFIDGFYDIERVKEEVAGVAQDRRRIFLSSLRKEMLARVNPEIENESLFKFMEAVLAMDVSSLRKRVAVLRAEMDAERRQKEKTVAKKMRDRGVSGSAVIPNPQNDPDWVAYVVAARKRFGDWIKNQ